MGLSNPAFESQDSTDNVEAQVAEQAAPKVSQAETSAPAETKVSASTQVAAPASSALALGGSGKSPKELLEEANILVKMKDNLPTTWEMYQTINANQGQFQLKQDKVQIGEEIELRLASWQNQWVSAPGDMDAEGEGLVLYSDDGVNGSENSEVNDDHVEWLRNKGIEDRDRMTLKEHQTFLKELEHEKAHVQHKVILVGELIKANDKAMDVIGDLVQVHLPDTGRRAFDSHAGQSAYHIIRGTIAPEDVQYIKLTAKTAGQGKKQFTQIKMAYADNHGKQAKG